jgi:hypothetical protein
MAFEHPSMIQFQSEVKSECWDKVWREAAAYFPAHWSVYPVDEMGIALGRVRSKHPEWFHAEHPPAEEWVEVGGPLLHWTKDGLTIDPCTISFPITIHWESIEAARVACKRLDGTRNRNLQKKFLTP